MYVTVNTSGSVPLYTVWWDANCTDRLFAMPYRGSAANALRELKRHCRQLGGNERLVWA